MQLQAKAIEAFIARREHIKGLNMAIGIVLIAMGLVYLWKPTIFRRGIWLKSSIAIRTLSETNYQRYMRILGIVLIFAGVIFIARAV
jgi:uncharacterized protein YjeT (DUF2065 family)